MAKKTYKRKMNKKSIEHRFDYLLRNVLEEITYDELDDKVYSFEQKEDPFSTAEFNAQEPICE